MRREPVADLVVVGRIHTVAERDEVAEALAAVGGKIVFAGAAASAEARLASPRTFVCCALFGDDFREMP